MRKIRIFALAALLLASLALPTLAYQSVGTWRSPAGDVMTIYPSFQVLFRFSNGQQVWGQGWWLVEGATFNYRVGGYDTLYAELVTNDVLRVNWSRGQVYWQRIGNRGTGEDAPAPPDDTWFTRRPDSALTNK